jgi:hypothetical protein
MPNCVDINLHINPLKEGLDITSYGTTRHIEIALNDINYNLILFLSTLNLTIGFAELFYTPPVSVTVIHLDAFGGDYTKLNYVYGGKNSFMNWYKQKPNILNSPNTTTINSSYIRYRRQQVDLIDTQQVKFPSIVQVGIPHNIYNFEEPRYCLSLVLRKHDNTRLTMAESIALFTKIISIK